METQAAQVIERLYEVFAEPRPAVVDYCDHCVDPADVAPFTTVPLRALTPEHVEKFWLRSGTIGDAGFVRYLLPRVLELIADGGLDGDFFWLGLMIEAHTRGELREQTAIQEFLLATPRVLAAVVLEIVGSKNPDGPLGAWLRGAEPLAVLEEAALGGADVDGRFSEAHLVLEGWR